MMNFFRVKITKEDLNKLSEDEQIFFFQLTHFLNEINMLQKCLIISCNGISTLNEIEKRGQISFASFFIILLAGKLKEGWEILQKNYFNKKQFCKDFDKLLSCEAKDSLSKIKQYFGQKDNKIYFIRNKFAFHYDRHIIKEELNNMTENELFEMFFSEEGGNANCLYDSVAQRAMLRHLDPSDVGVAMQILMDEVVRDVCKWFLDFGGDFLLIIARKLNINFSKAEISDLPSIRMLSLPYFVKQ